MVVPVTLHANLPDYGAKRLPPPEVMYAAVANAFVARGIVLRISITLLRFGLCELR